MDEPNPNRDALHLLTTTGSGILRLRQTKWMPKRNGNSQKQIDDLPDKILKIILNRLTWSQLVHLRIVCKRWCSVIYSMGEEKKLLIVNFFLDEQTNKMKRSFFGTLDFDNCARVKLKMLNRNSPVLSLETLIVGLFPSVDQIVFNCNGRYRINNFVRSNLDLLSPKIVSLSITIDDSYGITFRELYCIADHINRLTALRQLEICGKFAALFLGLIAQKIRELDHFSYSNLHDDATYELTEVVGNWYCTRFALDSPRLLYDITLQWHNMHLFWVTHLQLSVDIAQFDQFTDFLSMMNAPFLKVFRFDAKYSMRNTNGTITLLPLTLQAMDHLSHLAHLEELELKNVFFESAIRLNISQFLRARICTLRIDVERGMECDAFCRILSGTFPNVQHLNISLMHRREHFRRFFYHRRDYLAYFRALRTRNFVEEVRPYD